MKHSFYPAYLFKATHHPIQSNVYSLKLIDDYIDKKNRVHPQILRINSWDDIEINLNSPAISIYPVLSGGEHYLPEMVFYKPTENVLMGKDLQTDRLVYGKLFGPVDENGIIIPVRISLQIGNVNVGDIYNFPTLDYNDLRGAA